MTGALHVQTRRPRWAAAFLARAQGSHSQAPRCGGQRPPPSRQARYWVVWMVLSAQQAVGLKAWQQAVRSLGTMVLSIGMKELYMLTWFDQARKQAIAKEIDLCSQD